MIYHAYGNTANFSHTNPIHFSGHFAHWNEYGENAEKCQRPCQNSPFRLRHVDIHLTHECLCPPHSPRQTTARSLYALQVRIAIELSFVALPHNDATKSPLVTMGLRKFTPKQPLPLRRSPPKSNIPIPSPTPLTTRNGILIQSELSRAIQSDHLFSAVISEHISKNRVIISVVAAKIWYLKKCTVFIGPPWQQRWTLVRYPVHWTGDTRYWMHTLVNSGVTSYCRYTFDTDGVTSFCDMTIYTISTGYGGTRFCI